MMFPSVQNYHGSPIPPFSFFIIKTGEEAGKPVYHPTDDCYVVYCANKECFDRFYFLILGIYEMKKFKIKLTLSGIPIINREEIRSKIRLITKQIHDNRRV